MAVATDVADAQAVADAALSPAAETPAETPSPAPADAPETPADGPEAPVVETPPASDVPSRDEQGRFTTKPDAAAEPGPTETPTEQAAEPDISTYPAFNYRAEGRDQEYPGAVQDDQGNVLFTPKAVQQLKHDLAYARAYPRRDAEAQRDLSRETKAREAAETTLQHTLATFDQMVEQSQGWSTTEELLQTPLGQWLMGLSRNWPALKAESMQKGYELRTKALEEELQQTRQRDQDAQQRPQLVSLVEEAVQHWGTQAGLTPKELDELRRKYTADDMLDQVFPRATADDPANGLKAGQRRDNREIIRQELLFLNQLLKGRTPAQAAADVKKENEARLGKSGTKPPPMASVAGGKPAGAKPKQYKSTREADDDIWS